MIELIFIRTKSTIEKKKKRENMKELRKPVVIRRKGMFALSVTGCTLFFHVSSVTSDN